MELLELLWTSKEGPTKGTAPNYSKTSLETDSTMAAVYQVRPTAHKLGSQPTVTTTERPESMVSFKTMDTETATATESVRNSVAQPEENDDGDESLILAIRALRLLENPQAAATEAIQAFDPKASLHPDLVRLLVAAAINHPDVAQGLVELGQSHQDHHLVRSTSYGTIQQRNGEGAGRAAHSLLHEISISSLLSSISESTSRRAAELGSSEASAKPTLKRRLSVLSSATKKGSFDAQQHPVAPPPRKEKISLDSIKKICKANLKDTQESIEALERADFDDEFIGADELKRMAEESLGHETGKFALCLALTLRDEAQRWEATQLLMTAMADKLKLLLTLKGRFGPDGDVGLPGQDGFGIRDCWVVLSEAERQRLAVEDDGAWPRHLRTVAQLAPRYAAKAWDVLGVCDAIQESLMPSRRSSVEGAEAGRGSCSSSDGDRSEGGAAAAAAETPRQQMVKHQAATMAAASPQEITDRWAFFFDLLDEEAARRCFRELRLLRQLFNAAGTPASPTRAANLKSRARRAFDMGGRAEDDVERWLDTKWAMTAMKGFLVAKAQAACGDGDEDGGAAGLERLDRLDNAFCKTFWACLGSGDHRRLAKEDGKQWVLDIMRVFEDRRRYDVMFRLRDILHFMQSNM